VKSSGNISFACISVNAGYRPDLNRRISPVLFLIKLSEVDLIVSFSPC
jgi:hypothetical protein